MEASTTLEIVRMLASALGGLLAFMYFFIGRNEFRTEEENQPEVVTHIDLANRQHADMIRHANRVRAGAYFAIQLGMFYVAQQAYWQADPVGPISRLSLDSNLNQIFAIAVITWLTWVEISNINSRRQINEQAQLRLPEIESKIARAAAATARRRAYRADARIDGG